MALLEEYDWPGNIRQLENVIERLVVMTDKNTVTTQDIEQILTEEVRVDSMTEHLSQFKYLPGLYGRPYSRVREHDREGIMKALQQSGGNKTQAAKQLGLTVRQLHYRLTKLDIEG